MFLTIYLIITALVFLGAWIWFIIDESDFSKDFYDFAGTVAVGIAAGTAVAAVWPLVAVMGIPALPLWLIWKSQHTKAKLAKEA